MLYSKELLMMASPTHVIWFAAAFIVNFPEPCTLKVLLSKQNVFAELSVERVSGSSVHFDGLLDLLESTNSASP